jgi:hypothetical protein
MSQAALDKIHELNGEYRALTGSDAYLYASQPASTTVYTFVTNARPFTNAGDALAHMQDVVEKARSGWTHKEIVYGKERNPYPNAPRVNRGAW